MILITNNETEYLRLNNMGKYITVSSKTHKSKAKKYYLTENPGALALLNKYRESITNNRVR